MRTNPWEKLLKILEDEKQAIVAGDVEKLLECVRAKETLLKAPELKQYPLDPKLRQRITTLARYNEMLLKAGLDFIEEAYRFLNKNFTPKVGYSPDRAEKTTSGAQMISVKA